MKILPMFLAGLSLASAGVTYGQRPDGSATAGASTPDFKFIDVANMDTTVSPADNFFLYANGAWLKHTEIPGDQTSWGSFDVLQEETKKKLKVLITDVADMTTTTPGSNQQMVRDFYRSGMDTAQIEKAGLAPMQPLLDRIAAVSSVAGLQQEIAREQTEGLSGLFGFWVGPDDKQVTNEICQFYQGGLGLSPKSAYFDQDPRSVANRKAYIQYIHDLLVLIGRPEKQAAEAAQAIFDLEKKLASASLSPVEMRNPQRLYNKFSVKEVEELTPEFDWSALLSNMQIKGEDSIIVAMPGFFKALSQQLNETPLSVWKQYLAFHAVSRMAPYLSKRFSDRQFNFYGKVIYGQKEQKPRWQRVIHAVDRGIGDALGQLYVARYFPPDAKVRMNTLVNNLQKAFAERITHLAWMSKPTKEKALEKLKAITKKIAYPDKWKTYDGVVIVPDNYVQNVLNAAAFDYRYTINKLGKPVDKSEWGMTPQTVNAYYNPSFNEIVFPAGILQFPFFDFNADDAVNYGGIGAVIGHEMTHGFDDQGAQYDAQGYLRNWWTTGDSAKFAEKTNLVREQFNDYRVLDTIPVNGSLTLGENLADMGGVAIAYDAFKKTEQGQRNEKINGFTADQRFFLSWAQVWRGKSTPEALVKQIKTDPHAPEQFRCNGPLSNFEPFYEAFDVEQGDKMWRPESERAKVW